MLKTKYYYHYYDYYYYDYSEKNHLVCASTIVCDYYDTNILRCENKPSDFRENKNVKN